MFRNKYKQQSLEKAREKFLGWIEKEADSELEILLQGAVQMEATTLKLEEIRSQDKLPELIAQYQGNLLEDLKYIERVGLGIATKAIFLKVKMVFSLLSVVIAALLIFLIPTLFFSIKYLAFLPEDWRSDLEETVKRLEKAGKSQRFIKYKKLQFLLGSFWAGMAIAWDNLWLSENAK